MFKKQTKNAEQKIFFFIYTLDEGNIGHMKKNDLKLNYVKRRSLFFEC